MDDAPSDVKSARGDLRTLSNAQTESIRAKMRAIVARPLAGAQAEIKFEDGYPAMAPSDGSRALLVKLNEVNRDLGLEPMPELDPLKRGAGDIGFVGDLLPGLIGFGDLRPHRHHIHVCDLHDDGRGLRGIHSLTFERRLGCDRAIERRIDLGVFEVRAIAAQGGAGLLDLGFQGVDLRLRRDELGLGDAFADPGLKADAERILRKV